MNSKSEPIDIDNWTTQLRKGLLELCIVNLLAGGDVYAYDLVKRLAKVRGLVVSEGTIYPLLSRLRRMGLLTARLKESPSGPARKYYGLTQAGWQVREMMNTYWGELIKEVVELQKRKGGENRHG